MAMNLRRKLGIGSPEVLSDDAPAEKVERFFAELDKQLQYDPVSAARAAGLTKLQYETLARRKDVEERLRAFRASLLDQIEDAAVRQALAGDGAMIRFVLQSERPEKYGTKAGGKTPGTVRTFEDLKALTDEELAQLEAECNT